MGPPIRGGDDRRLLWIILGVCLAGTTGGNLIAPYLPQPPRAPTSTTTISLPPGATASQALVAMGGQLTPARIRELRAVVAEEQERMVWSLRANNPPGPTRERIAAIEEWIRAQDSTWRPPTYDWRAPHTEGSP